MTRKICFSFDPAEGMTSWEIEELKKFKGQVFSELDGIDCEPFEAVHKTSDNLNFRCTPSSRMDALVILHRSALKRAVHFDMSQALLPMGRTLASIPVFLVEFPEVDYGHFTVNSTECGFAIVKAKSDDRFVLADLIPELFMATASA